MKEENITNKELLTVVKNGFKDMEERFTGVEERFTGVEGRFTGVEGRFTGVEERFTGMEERFLGVEERLTGVEKNINSVKEDVKSLKEDSKSMRMDIDQLKKGAFTEIEKESIVGMAEQANQQLKDDATGIKSITLTRSEYDNTASTKGFENRFENVQ